MFLQIAEEVGLDIEIQEVPSACMCLRGQGSGCIALGEGWGQSPGDHPHLRVGRGGRRACWATKERLGTVGNSRSLPSAGRSAKGLPYVRSSEAGLAKSPCCPWVAAGSKWELELGVIAT